MNNIFFDSENNTIIKKQQKELSTYDKIKHSTDSDEEDFYCPSRRDILNRHLKRGNRRPTRHHYH